MNVIILNKSQIHTGEGCNFSETNVCSYKIARTGIKKGHADYIDGFSVYFTKPYPHINIFHFQTSSVGIQSGGSLGGDQGGDANGPSPPLRPKRRYNLHPLQV